ncbi:putative sugar O-methyltransferase [Patescibacteria group bacterium]|nr:putative sugar O-methyltransferase [Patescibacteria group bacterium]
MLTYQKIIDAIREGGFRLLFQKIRIHLIAGHDQNFFFHSMPKGFPKGELEIKTFFVGDEDVALAKRVLIAYRKALEDEKKYVLEKVYNDAWDNNRSVYHDDLLKILDSGDPNGLADYLVNMHQRKSTYGISGNAGEFRRISSSSYLKKKGVAMLKDFLASFAEAVGILPYEAVVPYVEKKNIYVDPDLLVAGIEGHLGIKIIPPNVEGGLFKLSLKKGGVDFRDLWALYAAWRVSEIVGKDAHIGEIGGGLGKVAFYAHRFGFKEYSLFDLPIMNVMTAWHLIKALPDTHIVLYGESGSKEAIRVLPYWEFANRKFDLVLNQDSFPEMSRKIVKKYLCDIKQNSKYFMSINQEHQAPLFPGADNKNLLVYEMVKEVEGFKRVSRFPCWVRKGYVEEFYEILP